MTIDPNYCDESGALRVRQVEVEISVTFLKLAPAQQSGTIDIVICIVRLFEESDVAVWIFDYHLHFWNSVLFFFQI